MTVSIALVYPELLGTYGDGGNATVLAQRLRWRAIEAEIVPVAIGETLPQSCDIYVLGGGEDAPQTLAEGKLASDGLPAIVDHGAAVLAVCAGMQVLGRAFTAVDGVQRSGLGILDCATVPK